MGWMILVFNKVGLDFWVFIALDDLGWIVSIYSLHTKSLKIGYFYFVLLNFAAPLDLFSDSFRGSYCLA